MSAGAKTLLIEDDCGITEPPRRVLADEGQAVAVEKHGDQVLAHAVQESLNVVLADLRQPALKGLDLARQPHAAQPCLRLLASADQASQTAIGPRAAYCPGRHHRIISSKPPIQLWLQDGGRLARKTPHGRLRGSAGLVRRPAAAAGTHQMQVHFLHSNSTIYTAEGRRTGEVRLEPRNLRRRSPGGAHPAHGPICGEGRGNSLRGGELPPGD